MTEANDANSYREAIVRYAAVRPHYESLARYLERVLSGMATGLEIHPIVTARAKSLESFAEKIIRQVG